MGFPCLSQTKVDKRAKNIILLIGDGMGTTQIYAAMVAKQGKLNLERCTDVGFSKTHTINGSITDSGAGATALAIGQKTYGYAIGVDADKKIQVNIREIAETNGLATGLVATCSITHATPASFIAHQPYRAMEEDIAADFLKSNIDVFIGGGRQFFTIRKDGRNLINELIDKGYQISDTTDDFTKFHVGKLAAFTAGMHPKKMSEGRGDLLLHSTQTAIKLLNQNKKGFFLMVEGSQIDWGGHANDSQYIINEMLDFDKAIGAALDFAEKDGNTLVIITADHETGGYAITDGNFLTGKVEGKFSTSGHTGVMVPVFAYGTGAGFFKGVYENNTIFDKMMAAFRFKKKQK
ncbi:MAG: alkaline phosphatase [Verrucomicrobia bacterium]|nr:alkaline phosphatase [Cytophagales bacterium]